MRDKLLAALAIYAEGATAERAIKESGLTWAAFYKTQRDNPDLKALYKELKQNRADMAGDKILSLAEDLAKPPEIGADGTEKPRTDANRARAAIEAWLKMMGKYHPEEFGDKLKLEHEIRPNLVAAIDEGKRRALLPQRDLANVIEAQYTEIAPIAHAATSDKQSAASGIAVAPGDIDPFAP